MKKNNEIRFQVTTEFKEEIDEVIKESLTPKLSDGYFMLLELGLRELKLALMNNTKIIKIEEIPPNQEKKLIFEKYTNEKGGKKNDKRRKSNR